ncbi:hypothetical protein B0H19DRAFT_1094993, partial [Mycena capillaripes]
MSFSSLRYIPHTNHPPADLASAHRDILNVLGVEVKRVQNYVSKIRKAGSVYDGITGYSLMAHHLSTAQLDALPGLSPAELLAFTDAQLTEALNVSPISVSSPSGSYSSFMETEVGLATLSLIRAIEHSTVNVSPFCNSWTSCTQLFESATAMAISEDRQCDTDDNGGCEVLCARAGLLYALLRVRGASRRSDIKTTDSNSSDLVMKTRALSSNAQLQLLVQSVICRGEAGAATYAAELAEKRPAPPLMWTWHGERYLGAVHGVAGILHILLLCPAEVIRPYINSILLTDTQGNWPSAAPTGNSTGQEYTNELVQWCHGASGILLLLSTATTASAGPLLDKVMASAQAGASLVYRHGLMFKSVGLCHGVGGSVFALLALLDVLDPAHTKDRKTSKSNATQLANEENYYLARAVHLAQLAANHETLTARGEMDVPDHRWSLYEGMTGMCCAWAEVLRRLEGRPCDRSVAILTWASW